MQFPISPKTIALLVAMEQCLAAKLLANRMEGGSTIGAMDTSFLKRKSKNAGSNSSQKMVLRSAPKLLKQFYKADDGSALHFQEQFLPLQGLKEKAPTSDFDDDMGDASPEDVEDDVGEDAHEHLDIEINAYTSMVAKAKNEFETNWADFIHIKNSQYEVFYEDLNSFRREKHLDDSDDELNGPVQDEGIDTKRKVNDDYDKLIYRDIVNVLVPMTGVPPSGTSSKPLIIRAIKDFSKFSDSWENLKNNSILSWLQEKGFTEEQVSLANIRDQYRAESNEDKEEYIINLSLIFGQVMVLDESFRQELKKNRRFFE